MKDIFDVNSYKTYLRDAFGGTKRRTGQRSRAALAIGCQTGYLSQVLNDKAQLSIEQALEMSRFLGHSADETEMFLLLVQHERAGTKSLREHLEVQKRALIDRRLIIKNRLKIAETLSPADQTTYYSVWYYSCIHVMLSIASLRTKEAIAQYLNLPLPTVATVLEFLTSRGLARIDDHGLFQIGPRHIHLGYDSDNIRKHHTNWRIRAIDSLDQLANDDLHYSVVVSLSRNDVRRLKDRLIETIQENLKTVQASGEEALYCQTIDLFEIQR
jgi:uncharacterized protein (TIGR02147 family)